MKTWQKIVTTSFALTTAAFSLACGPDDPPENSPDLFRVAVSGLAGGSLLSVYGDARTGRAYLAGGYVGVDPARVPGRAGRLVRYCGGESGAAWCATARAKAARSSRRG